MPFKKGQSGNTKGPVKSKLSPVTLSLCKNHYETAVKLCGDCSRWENTETYFNALMKILQFEHAELFGKPKEKVDVNLTGETKIRLVIE